MNLSKLKMTTQTEGFKCQCGKSYKHFSSYKHHFLSCSLIRTQSLSNAHILSPQIPNDQQQTNLPANKQFNSQPKVKCVFCQLNINSAKLNEHITLTCQQRYKNTQEYIELSKLGIITNQHTNKEIRAMCLVIKHLTDTRKIQL